MDALLAGSNGMQLLFALALTALLVGVLAALRRLFRSLCEQVDSRLLQSGWVLAVQDMQLLTAPALRKLLLLVVQVVHALAALFAIYLYIPVLLRVLPGAEPLARPFADYFLAPVFKFWEAIEGYLPSLISLLVILFYAWLALKLLYVVKVALQKGYIVFPGFHPEWSEPTYKILRFLVLMLTLAMVVPLLPGAESPAFKGVSLFVGAMVTLGSTAAMGNVTSGIILIYTRAFNVGDIVRVGEAFGQVVERSLVATRVRSPKNEIVTIPNSTVLNSQVVNYSDESGAIGHLVHVSVSIGYDVDWRQVHALLEAAARHTDAIEPEPVPFVLQKSLGDYSVCYEINAYTKLARDLPGVYSDLNRNILDQFTQANVEILSPSYTAIRDGQDAAIPSTER